jgi:hypothetical protein
MIRKIKSLLSEGEEVICVARIQGFIFAAPIIYTLIGVCVWIFFNPVMGGAISDYWSLFSLIFIAPVFTFTVTVIVMFFGAAASMLVTGGHYGIL